MRILFSFTTQEQFQYMAADRPSRWRISTPKDQNTRFLRERILADGIDVLHAQYGGSRFD